MLNRTMCDVLEDMRKLNETRNYSYLHSLVEEAQMMANRMESKLSDIKDFEHYHYRIKALKKEKRKLQEDIDALQDKKQ